LSSRSGPGALADKVSELGRGASAATVEEAASLDYVLLAVPWKNVEAALRGLPEWNGRVLIDATNPFVETGPSSFIRMDRLNEEPVKGQGKRVIFVSGDDEESKRVVKGLIESCLASQVLTGGALWVA
jgi:predicted dinucleotide-binding enzyme